MSGRKSSRATAGNRLRQLLDNELGEDEFYQQEMFMEEEEDVDFAQPEIEEEDQVDSDFDVPEDEPAEEETEEPGEADEKQRKKVGYVDPMSKKQLQKKEKGKAKPKDKGKGKEKAAEADGEVVKKLRGKPGPKPKPKPVPVDKLQQLIVNLDNNTTVVETPRAAPKKKEKKAAVAIEPLQPSEGSEQGVEGARKSRRKATVESSLQTEKKQLESSKKASQRAAYGAKTRVDHVYTQEELLAEAKITEEYNMESLRLYQEMELEKKAPTKKAVILTGPRIIYHSVKKKVEAIDGSGSQKDVEAPTSDSTAVEPSQNGVQVDQPPTGSETGKDTVMSDSLPPSYSDFYTHNTITLLNFEQYPPNLWSQESAMNPKKVAPSTGFKAKYRDPKTKIPFSTIEDFKEIQEKRKTSASLSEASKRLSRMSTMRQKTVKALKEILLVPSKACW